MDRLRELWAKDGLYSLAHEEALARSSCCAYEDLSDDERDDIYESVFNASVERIARKERLSG